MIIRNLASVAHADTRTIFATVVWEEQPFSEQVLAFEVLCRDSEIDALHGLRDEPSADAFLAACFPLAALHGELRVRIEGYPCPMLVEGLLTAHAWWASWGGVSPRAPMIESGARQRRQDLRGRRQGVACLSGGVDGLHMLMRNRRLYDPEDPAYIRDAVFVHGFDIGKRARP
jgi:hypothetical protein